MDKGIESMDRAKDSRMDTARDTWRDRERKEGLLVGKPYVAQPYLAFVILFCVS
jgi:hypothetical protein